ncbi:MAG: hypothetical protein ACM31O_17435 [Bacteroidota bacterium]
MKLRRYTLIRVDVEQPHELARAEYECGCGARVVVTIPEEVPRCRACDIAFRRFLTRTTSTTFKAKDFKPLPAG